MRKLLLSALLASMFGMFALTGCENGVEQDGYEQQEPMRQPGGPAGGQPGQ